MLSFGKDLHGRIFLLLGEITRSPNIDKDLVKATGEFGVVKVQQFGWERVWPCHFPIRPASDSLRHLADSGIYLQAIVRLVVWGIAR